MQHAVHTLHFLGVHSLVLDHSIGNVEWIYTVKKFSWVSYAAFTRSNFCKPV